MCIHRGIRAWLALACLLCFSLTGLRAQTPDLVVPGFVHSDPGVSKILGYQSDPAAYLGPFANSSFKNAYLGDVAFGPDGYLYFLSTYYQNISSTSFTSYAQVERHDGKTGAPLSVLGGLGSPVSLTFGPDKGLYVADRGSGGVLRYNAPLDKPGAFTFFVPFDQNGGLQQAAGLAFGPDGNLYVSDGSTNAILRYQGPSGSQPGQFINVVVTAVTGYHYYGSLKFGSDGLLYVSDRNSANILRYNPQTGAPTPAPNQTGAVFIPAVSGVTNTHTFYGPSGMAFAADGSLYVTDSENGILHFDKTGALLGTVSGSELYSPSGIALRPAAVTSVVSVASVTLDYFGAYGGYGRVGTVHLTAPAPTGGSIVYLSVNHPVSPDAATVPPAVTVPEGQDKADFPITTYPVTAYTNVKVSARAAAGGVSQSIGVAVFPPALQDLSLSASTISVNDTVTAKVTLTSPAPTGGTAVLLTFKEPNTHSTLTVAAGDSTAAMPFSLAPGSYTITATLADVTKTAFLTVSAAKPAITSLTYTTLTGGGGQLVIQGQNFVATDQYGSANVTLTNSGGVHYVATVNSSSHISVLFQPQSLPDGYHTVVVTNPDGQAAQGAFTVLGPKPAINSVSYSVLAGAGGAQLNLTGQNFIASDNLGTANVTVTNSGGATVTATVNSPTHVNILLSQPLPPGVHMVTEKNPDGQAAGFTLHVPRINGLHDAIPGVLYPVRSGQGNLTINGLGFYSTDPNGRISLSLTDSKGVSYPIGGKIVDAALGRQIDGSTNGPLLPGDYILTVTNSDGPHDSISFTIPEPLAGLIAVIKNIASFNSCFFVGKFDATTHYNITQGIISFATSLTGTAPAATSKLLVSAHRFSVSPALSGTNPAPVITSVLGVFDRPDVDAQGNRIGNLILGISGENLISKAANGALAQLLINGTDHYPVDVAESQNRNFFSFPLHKQLPVGVYEVQVINPDGQVSAPYSCDLTSYHAISELDCAIPPQAGYGAEGTALGLSTFRSSGASYQSLRLTGSLGANGPVGVVAAGGGNFVALSKSAVVAAGGGNVVAAGGGNVVAAGGGNVVAAGGGNVVAAGGGNVVAAGGGNVVAAGGGNVIVANAANVIPVSAGFSVSSPVVAAGGGNIASHLQVKPRLTAASANNFTEATLFISQGLKTKTLMLVRYAPGQPPTVLFKSPDITLKTGSGPGAPVIGVANLTLTLTITHDTVNHLYLVAATLTNTGNGSALDVNLTATLASGSSRTGVVGLPSPSLTLTRLDPADTASGAVQFPDRLLAGVPNPVLHISGTADGGIAFGAARRIAP